MKTQLLRETLKCFSLFPPTSHTTCDVSKTTIFLEQLLGVCGREVRGMQGAQFPSHLSLSLFVKPLTFILSGHTQAVNSFSGIIL